MYQHLSTQKISKPPRWRCLNATSREPLDPRRISMRPWSSKPQRCFERWCHGLAAQGPLRLSLSVANLGILWTSSKSSLVWNSLEDRGKWQPGGPSKNKVLHTRMSNSAETEEESIWQSCFLLSLMIGEYLGSKLQIQEGKKQRERLLNCFAEAVELLLPKDGFNSRLKREGNLRGCCQASGQIPWVGTKKAMFRCMCGVVSCSSRLWSFFAVEKPVCTFHFWIFWSTYDNFHLCFILVLGRLRHSARLLVDSYRHCRRSKDISAPSFW